MRAVFLIICLLMGAGGREVSSKAPESFQFKLSNGLQVIVLPNKRVPAVGHLLWYPVGSADDPHGKTGLAHYLEHMMFKGPPGSASASITAAIERVGGIQNASTTYDFTMYYNIIGADHLDKVMKLEAGRMKTLEVLVVDAEPELKVIFEERRMRFENSPFGEFFTLLMGHFFQYHPYRNPPIGWEGDLKNLKAEDVQSFHNAYYAPNGAVLVLVGDITLAKAQRLAQVYYGAILPKKIPGRKWLLEPTRSQVATTIKFASPFISHPLWVRLYPLPLLEMNKVRESALFRLTEYLLGVDPWGYLFKEFVKTKKLATAVDVNFRGPTRAPSVALISAEPVPGMPLDILEKEILASLQTVVRQGFSEAQLQKAKDQILVQTAFEEDSLLGAASFYGEHLINGALFEDIQNREAILKSITLNEVNNFLKNVFSHRYHLTGYLLAQHPGEEGEIK